MERQLSELSTGGPLGDAPAVAISASVNRRIDHELEIGVLYDLTCHLVLDEREAERLLAAVLRESGRRAEGDNGRAAASIDLLVQTYLEQCRFPSRHFNPLSNLVRVRGKRKSIESNALEAGFIKLRPEERVCLILRERLGLSVAEIAEITGFQRERVSIALFEARERLRKFLPEEGDAWER